MPLVIVNTRAGTAVDVKAKFAAEVTDFVHQTIKSEYYHIGVLFYDLASESSYVAGKPGADTVINCNIRSGRSDGAVQALSKGISDIWHRLTGQPESQIEVTVNLMQAKFVFRNGKHMEEAPFA